MERKDIENVHPIFETSASQVSVATSGEAPPTGKEPVLEPITLIKRETSQRWWKDNGNSRTQYRLLPQQPQLRNNIKIGIGFLEFANALDFAANVWNQSPLPRFVVALMATGGSVSLLICTFAFLDFRLSWKNVCALKEERKYLYKIRNLHENEDAMCDIDRILGVNFRELTSEIVDRVLLDLFLGIGGILVGIGTLIAIPGAQNHRIYIASNFMSGYIGNAFPLVWGVINFVTSVYIWRRFHRQIRSTLKFCSLEPLQADVISRCHQFQNHASFTAVNGLVAGVAGMLTFKYWFAYIVLIPCIIASLCANIYFRMRIGYDRHLTTKPPKAVSPQTMSTEITGAQVFCISLQRQTLPSEIIALANLEKVGMTLVSTLLESNGLLPLFCEFLFNRDEDLARKIFPSNDYADRVVITERDFINADVDLERFHDLFKAFLIEAGPRHFECRRRYLLELMAYDFQHSIAR